jgi:hypothetical protein
MKSYFRLDYATASKLDTWMRQRRSARQTPRPSDEVRRGNFVLAARFNHAAQLGEVRAIGRIDRTTDRVDIDWRRAELDLRPQGTE